MLFELASEEPSPSDESWSGCKWLINIIDTTMIYDCTFEQIYHYCELLGNIYELYGTIVI